MTKLDYSIESPEQRTQIVCQYCEECEAAGIEIPPDYLEKLADYIIFAREKQERKKAKTHKTDLLTPNHMVTVNKHETSFEGLIDSFENSEDHVYSLITENKNILLTPKIKITQQDIEEIPYLKQIREAIELWQKKLPHAQGREAFIIKQAIIDLRKDQYIVKNAFRRPIHLLNTINPKSPMRIPAEEWIDENGNVRCSGASFTDPRVCAHILRNYGQLKADGYDNFYDDVYFFMLDFDALLESALADKPIYDRIALLKTDGLSNAAIQDDLRANFGVTYTPEYISSIWCRKIPKLLSQVAVDQFLDYYYTEKEYGTYKKCGRCGRVKLAHPRFFSRNASSRDGYYSICKECRRKKNQNDAGQNC